MQCVLISGSTLTSIGIGEYFNMYRCAVFIEIKITAQDASVGSVMEFFVTLP